MFDHQQQLSNANKKQDNDKCNIFLKCLQKMKRIFPKIDFNFLMVCLQWKGKHAKLQRISKEKES
ncbi:hypothetical protein T10_9852 [Trichinella papuae]|uniref:Uncharacterized protein n=1 Tax=Trichinella papuae TaxID=268474 RepID=A0A0V1MCF1_9BILA|nr:hypothetical protein T10_9852 [Trichinella papuae]